MIKSLFWISVAFPLYVYSGFPLLLWLLQALVRRAPRKQPIEPSVSLLIAAYNEAAVIAQKIRNSLALDYPAEKLEIVISSDGSEDATAEIVAWLERAEDQAAEDLCDAIFAEIRAQKTANQMVGYPYFKLFADAIERPGPEVRRVQPRKVRRPVDRRATDAVPHQRLEGGP